MKSRGLGMRTISARPIVLSLVPASAITARLHRRDHLPASSAQPRRPSWQQDCPDTTEDVFVQFFGMGQIGFAFFKLGGFEHLRRLILAAKPSRSSRTAIVHVNNLFMQRSFR